LLQIFTAAIPGDESMNGGRVSQIVKSRLTTGAAFAHYACM
jgi:hypothetical protein